MGNQQASRRAEDPNYRLVPIGALEIEGLLLFLHDPAVLGEDSRPHRRPVWRARRRSMDSVLKWESS